MRRAYDFVQSDHTLTIYSISDVGQRSQLLRVADRSSMPVVNRVEQPWMIFSTFVSFSTSHAFRDSGLGLVWNTRVQQLVES